MAPHHPGIWQLREMPISIGKSGKANNKEASVTCVVEVLRVPPTAARMQTPPVHADLEWLAAVRVAGWLQTAPRDDVLTE